MFLLTCVAVFFTIQRRRKHQLQINDNNSGESEVSSYPWLISAAGKNELSLYSPPSKLSLTDHLIDSIGHIINVTPKVKELVQKNNKILVKFKPEVMRKLSSGELTLLKAKNLPGKWRAIAVDSKNRKIASHGTLEVKDVKKINPAQLANAAFAVMSIITAQEYLDRINLQLGKLDRKVDTILRNYKNDKFGVSRGNIDYLMSIFPQLFDIPDEELKLYNEKIESIILQCYQQINSINIGFSSSIQKINQVEVKSMIKIDGQVTEITEELTNFEELVSLSLGNLEVMMICLKIKTDLNLGDQIINNNRIQQTEKYLKQIEDAENEFLKTANTKVAELKSKLRTDNQINKRKEKINLMIKNVKDRIKENMQDIIDLKHHKFNEMNQSFDLQVEHDNDGKIVAVYKLERKKPKKFGA